jgi:hypothetical protein
VNLCRKIRNGDQVGIAATVEILVSVQSYDETLLGQLVELDTYARTGLPWPTSVTVLVGNANFPPFLAATNDRMCGAPDVSDSRSKKVHRLDPQVGWIGTATVLAFLDERHLAEPSVLLPVLAAVVSGHSELAIATRMRGNRKTDVAGNRCSGGASQSILRCGLGAGFTDAGGGLLAIRGELYRTLQPRIRCSGSFRSAELLLGAQRQGHRIYEFAVHPHPKRSRPPRSSRSAGRIWATWPAGGPPVPPSADRPKVSPLQFPDGRSRQKPRHRAATRASPRRGPPADRDPGLPAGCWR